MAKCCWIYFMACTVVRNARHLACLLIPTYSSKRTDGIELSLSRHFQGLNVIFEGQVLDILQAVILGPCRAIQGFNLCFWHKFLDKGKECAWGSWGTSSTHKENARRSRHLDLVDGLDIGLVVTYLTEDDFTD